MPLFGLESIPMVAVGHREGDRIRAYRVHPILANEKAVKCLMIYKKASLKVLVA
jgi:hypothetical protein